VHPLRRAPTGSGQGLAVALRTRARKLQKLMGWPYQKCLEALKDKTLAEQKELLDEVEKDKSESAERPGEDDGP